MERTNGLCRSDQALTWTEAEQGDAVMMTERLQPLGCLHLPVCPKRMQEDRFTLKCTDMLAPTHTWAIGTQSCRGQHRPGSGLAWFAAVSYVPSDMAAALWALASMSVERAASDTQVAWPSEGSVEQISTDDRVTGTLPRVGQLSCRSVF